MFNDEAFSRVKRGVRIVNVAHGGVIDEEALLRALNSEIVAQAALDVFTEEPPPKENKLVQHENVTVTPHLGASNTESQEGVALEIAEALVGALKGKLAASSVNAPVVPTQPGRQSYTLPEIDQPGIIGSVGSILGEENVNVNFMSVGRNDHWCGCGTQQRRITENRRNSSC